MTAFHYVVKDVTDVGPEYFVDLYVSNPKDWIGNKRGTSQQKIMDKLDVQYPWLNALIKLIESITKSKRARQSPFLSMEDKKNQSVFDKLEEITKASSRLTGSNGIVDSILELSLTPAVFAYDITISEGLKNHVLTLSKPYKPALIPRSFTRVFA